MTDWEQMLTGATPTRVVDIQALKAALPLEWVVLHEGLVMEPDGTGRLVSLCPFHEDTTPSFAIFTQPGDEIPLARIGCWGCDFRNGDVFDFLERLRQVPPPQARQIAAELLIAFRADQAWSSRAADSATTIRPKADPLTLLQHARNAQSLARTVPTAIERLIDERANNRGEPGWQSISPGYLIDVWRVGVEDDWEIVVPHLGLDESGAVECLGLKVRTPRSPLIAKAGSDLSHLYGEYQLQGHRRVVLCEGESDAWCTAFALRGHETDVLALPSGSHATARAPWLDKLVGRDVVLAFDGDRAGRVAARRWTRALAQRMQLGTGHGPLSVSVATLPDGKDLSSVDDLLRVLMEAGPVPDTIGNVSVAKDRPVYVRTTPGRETKDDPDPEPIETVIANWALEPLRELVLDTAGTKGYEGLVRGRDVLLRTSDLESQSAVTKWAGAVGGNWTGTAKDAQNILGVLQSEGPFLARGRACSVIGWHDRNFVLPQGYIGPDYWRYLPPPASIAAAMSELRIEPGDWDPHALTLMRDLNRHNVTDPIIAWLFAAPLRSLFPVFPFLAVTGVSGNGKTAMMEAMLEAFGWKLMTTLTNSTPHGVQSFAGATNGIPVWFDEYRQAAREDSKTQLDQVLRDAYNASPSFKGGGSGENRLSLTAMPTGAPIIVTGEDAFQETSHFERMVLVKLDKKNRNPQAYRALRTAETTGLGYAYLRWLVESHNAGLLPSLSLNLEAGRVAVNRQILGIGWELARMFYGAATGEDLGAPDLDKLRVDLEVELSTDPFTNAMVWARFEPPGYNQHPIVWHDGDDVIVRPDEMISAVRRKGVFTLPGGLRAFENYLEAEWAGRPDLDHNAGRTFRLIGQGSRFVAACSPDPEE